MLSVVVNVHMCGRRGEKGAMRVESKVPKNGAIYSEHRVGKGGNSQLSTQSHHSMSEGYLFTFRNATHAIT